MTRTVTLLGREMGRPPQEKSWEVSNEKDQSGLYSTQVTPMASPLSARG